MTLDQFMASLEQPEPPAGVHVLLAALWHDANGDWDKAHQLAQDTDSADGAWVHAYLHRKEGDAGNARYWYRRAGHDPSSAPLEEEWRAITAALLQPPSSR